MASPRLLRGQSELTVSLSTPRLLTALIASLPTATSDQVSAVSEDFATALEELGAAFARMKQIEELLFYNETAALRAV
jgi:hypothetical protein